MHFTRLQNERKFDVRTFATTHFPSGSSNANYATLCHLIMQIVFELRALS